MINLTSPTGLDTLNASVSLTEDEIAALKKNVDDSFLIFNGIMASFMQAGFACLEVGTVRTKNSTNIIMKNLCDMCTFSVISGPPPTMPIFVIFILAVIALVAYYILGYAVAYGGGGNSFIGSRLIDWNDMGIPNGLKAHWFFQFIFSATAATVLTGAVAERCHFITYIVYTFCISGFVYPVVSHWVWANDGWLNVFGFEDFAGSGAVHALAGTCSFVGAAFLGPRTGRFVDGKPVEMPGHNLAFVGIGALLLISGFLAFNAGSLGHITQPGDSSIVSTGVINTIAGGSGALFVALVLGHILGSAPWPFSSTLNATLTGMVSSCGGLETYATWSAIVIGCIGGLIYFGLACLLLIIKVDDPLEATCVHFGGGSVGVLMRPILSYGTGIFFTGSRASFMRLYKNFVGLMAIIAWSAVCSCVIFGFMKMIKKLRLSSEDELKGSDIVEHGEPCYSLQAWSESVTPSIYERLPQSSTPLKQRE